MRKDSDPITDLLNDAAKGNREAESLLVDRTYQELHRLATHHMRSERGDHTLQTTALVNEAYVRLFDRSHRTWTNRTHFLGYAARVMRHILIDYARSHRSLKQGGHGIRLPFDEKLASQLPPSADLLALDAALDKLAELDPRQVRIVELRFFAGLTEEEIAEALHIGTRTVTRDWAVAKAWLQKELSTKT